MNTKRFTFFFVFLLFLVQGIWAQHVSPEQAKEKASQFLKANYARTGGKRSAPAASALKTAVVFNAKDTSGQPYLYAVTDTRQSGFVLVSGDERFNAVLGYSDDGTFDEQNMPENMRVFLQGYIDEMKYLESINYQPTKAAPRRSMSNVGVLMTTTWNQRAPYNNQCPLDNSQRSATGCVATAMAQVVNYHIQNDHGPAATIAEIPGYTIPNTNITVSAIPSGTAIPSKDLLLNSYDNNAGTDAQKTAVAQLMLYCGTSVQMKYSSGSSGTQTAYVANALVNYFGFDNTTRFVRRIDYSYADWVDLIYNEVAASRPVVLGAGRAAGGHAFVADGFDATNTLFHINWGWGGYLDDYFALSVLNPDDAGQTGAAAGTDGYTIDQQAIVGIQHVGASGTTDPASLTMDSYRVEGTDIHFSAGNLTGTTNSFDIGVGVYDGSSITLFKLIASQSVSTGSAFPDVSASAICADFANQTRKLIPMSRVSGTSTWIPGADPDINYFSAVYDANGVPTLTAHPAPNFQNTTFDISAPVFVNTPQNTNVTFTNNGEEYYGMAYFFVSTDANNKGNYVAKRGLGAPTGVPTTVEFEWTPTSATTYYIWATTDEAGTNVIGSTSVTATTDASLAGKTLAIVDYQLEGQDDQSFQIDGNGTRSIDVYGSKLKGKVTIKNLSASNYNYNGKYITLTYKKWNGSQFVMIAHPYDIGVLNPTLPGGAEYTFDVDRDGLESGLYQISLTTFEINGGYVENRTELDERYTINLKPIGMTIASASDWETFCSNVNNGTTYSGQLVKLTADITTSTRMNGNFKGVFDGGGHTLNITISVTDGQSYCAPFKRIEGATIKNLTVTGSVTSNGQFTGGLVGFMDGDNNLIENCVVNANVTLNGYGGGVVGSLDESLTIKDVVYGGTITQNKNNLTGGIIGFYNGTNKSLTMTNCLFKGTYSGPSTFHPIGMKNTSSPFSTLSCTNCFYTANPQNNPDAGAIIADGTKVSQLSLGQGVSILSGSTCSFLNEVYHYGTVTLGYNDPEAVVTYSLDGTPLPGNSFTISKDNAAFDDGTATITAGYSFTISYNLDGGTVATANPTTYTSASSDITLNNPTREGWTFTGWTGTGLNGAQMTVTIAQGSTGHRHYTATWTADELATDDSGAYVINTKDDWNRFCARVTSGANSYEGATVKLTGNVGTAENPVTTMAGADVTHTFKGTFDGAGYTLTVNYNTAAGCTAPFRFVDGATIRNLHVAGTITSSEQFASGFVGEVVYGHDVNITNCRSSVAINSNVSSSNNGYGTHGGFVGAAQYIVNITGCIFDGSFTTTNGTHSCGGFIGYSWVGSEHMHISNSVLAPTSVSSGMLDKTFVRYGSGTPDITNCYYIPVTNMPTNQGKEAHTITAGENVSSVAIGGTATEYNVSGITAYEGSNGLKYGSTVYAGISDAVDLALTANPPAHYSVDTYTASAGSITTNSATSATLTMPNENVTIGATWKLRELNKDNEDNYLVESKDEWDLFCLRVNNGSTYSNETIKLTGDIGDAENPVTTIAGENEIKPFKGTFDGAGYTLTIGYGTSEARFDGQYAAPFRYVEGATIQNLHVAGIIYTAKQCAAGIVGQVKESPITLSNCHSSVDINCNYENSGGHGGLIAYIWPGLNGNSITGCLFDGSFTTSNNDNHSSGLFGVAGGTTTVTNCVVMPSNVSAGMLSNTFGYGSDITFTNCYYVPVENLPTTQGTAAHAISAGTNVTSLAISTTPTTTYNVSGITFYGNNKGIMIGDAVYAAENDEVDLTLAAPSQPGATVGFVASAGTLDQTDATHATLTMPNEDVTINAVYLVSTNYIAADGTSQSHAAKELTSSDHELTSGWYVVSEDVGITPYLDCYNNSTKRINVSGDVKLILADGATLDVTHTETPSVLGGIHVPAGSSLTIYRQSGGTGVLNASTNSSDEAAIGGGYPGLGWGNADAGTITIYGGTINAIAYDSGIGGTQGSHGGTVNIHGGIVTSQCNMGAAIGGGGSCTGFTVNIYGGTVNATGGTEAAAIGGGSQGIGGTVNIYGGNITANAIDYGSETPTDGFGIGSGASCTSLATVNLSWTNTTDCITATSYNGTVNLLKDFTATDGRSWLQGNGIVTKPDGKTLYPANTLLFLADNADNSADISAAKGNTRNVVLSGRTLYKDGKWNTLCLPFDFTAAQIAAHTDFAGAKLMELNTDGKNGFDTTDGTLYLAFKEATAIVAGVPYLVKWDAAGDDFTSPVFFGVTINATATTTVSDHDDELAEVQMVGCYSPVSVVADDKSILFLGDDNTLYYSSVNRNIRSCRAYFSVPYIKQNAGVKARAFVLNFDDEEATGILEISADSKEKKDDAWYSLAGVRLSGKPTQRGMYINKGNKVIIK